MRAGKIDPDHDGTWSDWQLGAFILAMSVMVALGYVLLLFELGAVVGISIYNHRRRRA